MKCETEKRSQVRMFCFVRAAVLAFPFERTTEHTNLLEFEIYQGAGGEANIKKQN